MSRVLRATFLFLLSAVLGFTQTDGSRRWAFLTNGEISSSPAVAADGTVYIGTNGTVASQSRLYAIAPNGVLKWQFTAGDWIESTPALAPDGTVYFGSWDGKLYALNPATGVKKWEYATLGFIASSPALAADGTIYFGSGDRSVYALNADGTLKWNYLVADWVDSAPAIGIDGTVYFGCWDSNVYALWPNGTLRWKFTTGGYVNSSPAIGASGTVYIGSSDGKLYALNGQTGVKLWEYATGAGNDASPVMGADGTVYFGSIDGYFYAVNGATGALRWQVNNGYEFFSSAAVRADGTIIVGASDRNVHAFNADGTTKWKLLTEDYVDSSPVIGPDGMIYVGSLDKKLYAIYGNGSAAATGSAWPMLRRDSSRGGRAATGVAPVSQAAVLGANVTFAAPASSSPAPSYQWQKNGTAIIGASSSTCSVNNVQPADAGLYTVTVTTSEGTTASASAILAPVTTHKVEGAAYELQADIRHPNGNYYDQLLLTGSAATFTADAGQVTRISYIDLNDDIVQVEFSGAGSVTLVLDSASGPALPINYNQAVSYMKGHGSIYLANTGSSTYVSVFTVGRMTAYDPTGGYNIALPVSDTNLPANNGNPIFQAATVYDGMADFALLAITSASSSFGGVLTANTSYWHERSCTGIYAPGVLIADGRVYLHDLSAFSAATPVLRLGSASNVRITGGSLKQDNAQAVQVSGFTSLLFAAGTDSHGNLLPAQANQAVLEENGVDVTAQLVTGGTP